MFSLYAAQLLGQSSVFLIKAACSVGNATFPLACINKALWNWVWEVEGLHYLYVGFFFFLVLLCGM